MKPSPASNDRLFILGLRPLLDAVWAGALGDAFAFGAVKRGLGTFYLSDYCNNGSGGPDDAFEPAAAAVLHAARAYMHGCMDFAVFVSGEALEAGARLAGEEGEYAEDPEELRAEELRRQLRDLDRIGPHRTDLRRARFGLDGTITARPRTALQNLLSQVDDLV
ncbi:hypothetical protein [Streptomyces sp. NPDC058108]|uniref:hypothetical protein n=1 Tax=Streptomyces sp. NPDC058108 TaxID=3346344 RepID=UPI0036E83954